MKRLFSLLRGNLSRRNSAIMNDIGSVPKCQEIGGKSPVARAIDKGKIFPARHLFSEIKMIQKPVFILAKDVTYVFALQIKSVCF